MKFLTFNIFLLIGLDFVRTELTHLEKYVSNDDDISVVNHQVLSQVDGKQFTLYTLNLTSLKWFNEFLSNRPVWWHHVYVSVPSNLDPSRPIFYYINDGINNASEPASKVTQLMSAFSVQCKCITVVQRQVPNQPIKFTGDPTGKYRVEDDIVASTLALYLYNKTLFPNESYNYVPLLFPMVKSVKRGFDEVTKFLKLSNIDFSEKFVVSGASKRGWTAWLITAVDSRVVSTMPIVFDLLNWQKGLHIQYMSLGGAYTFALYDYFLVGATIRLDTIEVRSLFKLIDPYSYLDKYYGKKFFLFTAMNDQFFLPENTKPWWKDLSIVTGNQVFIKRLANADHYLNENALLSIVSDIKIFYDLVQKETPMKRTLPILKWSLENNVLFGSIRIKLSNLNEFESYNVTVHSAITKNKKKIDFRANYLLLSKLEKSNLMWDNKPVSQRSIATSETYEDVFRKLRFTALFNYVGFYLDVNLKLKDSDEVFSISTDLDILPEYYPVGDCNGEDCFGKLV